MSRLLDGEARVIVRSASPNVDQEFVPLAAQRLALWPLVALASVLVGALIAMAHGYGYHRDELYFLVAGEHLAWSYPDQGPLTPLIAHLMSEIAPASLTVLRVPLR